MRGLMSDRPESYDAEGFISINTLASLSPRMTADASCWGRRLQRDTIVKLVLSDSDHMTWLVQRQHGVEVNNKLAA